ncbi:DMT family transporter [Corynebacterium suedekumii]|uniref:DMT family transporter n=1 Tax=Corynebacterium suedekumii TaxID=3049801 RepID=A0ABY8VNB1_9CORY|nr:DMT family transporter [Corynebacterium suedekumii]WIM71139.1 DMT family transporter [Corynebacterium suedekumii]
MHSYLLAVLFALASALTIAWGTVVRHRIVENAPAGSSPILVAMRRPLWWAGMSTAIIAYVLQVVALGFGPLLIVQPVLVMSLMFTLPLSAVYEGRRISRRETFWSAALTVAVTAIVLVGRPVGGEDHPPLERWIPALTVGVIVLVAMDRFARRQIRRERALIQGLVTGAVFGYVAVLSKAVADVFVESGFIGLLTNWEVYGLTLAATLGTWVQQNAFNAGALRNSLPAMKIAEPIVAFTLGYLVLFERFQVDGWEWLLFGAAFATMIASTVVLSRINI